MSGRSVFDVLSPGLPQVIPPCEFDTVITPAGALHEAKIAMHGREAKAVALIDHAELVEARGSVTELVAAVRERLRLSSASKHSTGPFADSDARIAAALAKFGGVGE